MGFCGCLRGLFLTLLSIITCGVIFLFMVVVVIVEKVKKFDEVSKTVFIVSVVICVLCGLLLLFAIYASCCGGGCAKGVLGVVFCVFIVILVAFAAVIWGLRNEVIEWIGENYEDKKLYEVVPKAFNCCPRHGKINGWWVPCLDEEGKQKESCKVKFEEMFDKFGDIVGAIAIILAVALLIGAILCFCACRKGLSSSS